MIYVRTLRGIKAPTPDENAGTRGHEFGVGGGESAQTDSKPCRDWCATGSGCGSRIGGCA